MRCCWPAPALPAAALAAAARIHNLGDVLDRDGNAVVCSVSLDNLFGTGRIVPRPRSLLAGPRRPACRCRCFPRRWPGTTTCTNSAPRSAGPAKRGHQMAVAVGMFNTMVTGQAMSVPVPDPGRANVIDCASYLPDQTSSCRWATDPRGGGLAVGAN